MSVKASRKVDGVVQHLLVIALLLDLAERAVIAGDLPAVGIEPGDVLVRLRTGNAAR
jgi:hypothetical protein